MMIAALWSGLFSLPLFFLGVVLASLSIHTAILLNTTWYPAFLQGKPAATAPEQIIGALREGGFSPTVLHRNLASRAAGLVEGSPNH